MDFRMRLNTAIGIRPAVEQKFNEIEHAVGGWRRYGRRQSIAIGYGQIKRCPTLRVRLIGIGSAVEQKFDDSGVTLLSGPHQSIGAAEVLLLLNAGTMTDEDFNRIQLSCARGHH